MKPTCARVLARLEAADGRWVPGLALAMPDTGGLRFGGRVHELRAMGYAIEDRPDPSGRTRVHQYRYLPAPVQLRIAL